MSSRIPRLRMFAGPNGSGKSILKEELPGKWLGVYLNPDELQKQAAGTGSVDLDALGVNCTEIEVLTFFRSSQFLRSRGFDSELAKIHFRSGKLYFDRASMNAYLASVLADFLRQTLMRQRSTFSFETVMSSPDKVRLLESARGGGYRTYLYYVATDDPDINVARVAERVRQGGHDVPEDKIRSRYFRSLDLLMDAIKASSRAYIFDNSGNRQKHTWLAEVTDGESLELRADVMPPWFVRSVLRKLG